MGYDRNNTHSNRYHDIRRNIVHYNESNETFRFRPGQKCRLTYMPDIEVLILRIGREQYECRILNDFRIEWFYDSELEAIE